MSKGEFYQSLRASRLHSRYKCVIICKREKKRNSPVRIHGKCDDDDYIYFPRATWHSIFEKICSGFIVILLKQNMLNDFMLPIFGTYTVSSIEILLFFFDIFKLQKVVQQRVWSRYNKNLHISDICVISTVFYLNGEGVNSTYTHSPDWSINFLHFATLWYVHEAITHHTRESDVWCTFYILQNLLTHNIHKHSTEEIKKISFE